MAIKWLWFSFVVDPALIIVMGILGVWLNTVVNDGNREAYKRVSEYTLKAVALTAAVVGISSFPSVFSAGANGRPMILLAFCTILLGTVIGAWSNFDERLDLWIEKHWSNTTTLRTNSRVVRLLASLDSIKQDKEKSFGWAAAYSTYVSIVGVLSIMGPIHESADGVLTFIIMKCVLDTVATLVFAMSWGPGVILSFAFVMLWQLAWGLAAPYLTFIMTPTVIGFADGVGGLIIMSMGLSVSGILKGSDGKSFRTGNLFPAMILSFIVGAIAEALNFYW
jgi:hypothetical protein